MTNIVADIAVNKDLVIREDTHSNIALNFKDSGGDAFNISTYTFSVQVRNKGDSTDILELTQGSGLTNGGATGILNWQFTPANVTTIGGKGPYFYQLSVTDGSQKSKILVGELLVLDESTNFTSSTIINITTNLGGATSTVTVNAVAGAYWELAGTSQQLSGNVAFVDPSQNGYTFSMLADDGAEKTKYGLDNLRAFLEW